MAQFLHDSATTTACTRAEIQSSQETVATLARRYGVNPKTVIKWGSRDAFEDLPEGSHEYKSTILTPVEDAAVVAFPVQTRPPLDDVFCALKPSIPALSRSTLHRCPKRHSVSLVCPAPPPNAEGGSRPA